MPTNDCPSHVQVNSGEFQCQLGWRHTVPSALPDALHSWHEARTGESTIIRWLDVEPCKQTAFLDTSCIVHCEKRGEHKNHLGWAMNRDGANRTKVEW